MQNQLKKLLEIQQSDYDVHFCHVEHHIVCDGPPAATLRLHFVKPDASGEPRFRELARLLAQYITHYCFNAERRRDLSERERNEMWMQARDLFRLSERSGQVGELLIYFLLETVLHAPQALKKMPMTTNPRVERHGSDGVHLRWDEAAAILEVIFAESKIHKVFSEALNDAFASIESFHESRTKRYEVTMFTSAFSNLDAELQEKVVDYIEGENVTQCRLTQACLIGFNWNEYECLNDERREQFIKEFERRYRAWADGIRDSLNGKLQACTQKHLKFEFFMLPFRDVEAFRTWFNEELTGVR